MPVTSSARPNQLALGTVFGILSALAYAGANTCLRAVAEDMDPMWVSSVRAIPVTIVSVVLCIWRRHRKLPAFAPAKLLPLLFSAALFVQFAGNVCFQWSLGQIGLAMSVPLLFGTMILGGALLGWTFLGEAIPTHKWLALFLLIVAIGLVSISSAESAGGGFARFLQPSSSWPVMLGVGAACIAGVGYAVINTVIRHTVKQNTPLSATLLVISATGIVVLGPLSYLRLGAAVVGESPLRDNGIVLVAGLFNAVAFYSLSKGLQLIPVAQINALISSQTAVAALVGILFFGESASIGLLGGVALMIVGLWIMQRPPTRSSSD